MKITKQFQGFLGIQLKSYFLVVLAGISIAAPFLSYGNGVLSFFALIPFFFLIRTYRDSVVSTQKQVLLTWLVGFVAMLCTVFWLLRVDTSFLGGLDGWEVSAGLVLTYILFAGSLSLGFVLFQFLYIKLRIDINSKKSLAIIPALWVLSEWARSWIFSILMVGENSRVGPNWLFGDLGFAASTTPIVYASRLVGLFGLSFIVVLINLAMFRIIKGGVGDRVISAVAIVVVCAISFIGHIAYKSTDERQVSVRALQVSSELKGYSNEDSLGRAIQSTGSTKSDLIVLPEHSSVFGDNAVNSSSTLKKLSKTTSTPIITSRDQLELGRRYNVLTVYSPSGEIVHEARKHFLIPIGEAMPYLYEYLYDVAGKADMVREIRANREVSIGDGHEQTYVIDGLSIASAACSSAVNPELYRKQFNKPVDVITNSASISMFDSTSLYYEQTLQMARFLAVSTARPFIQSTKGGYSFVIDSNGVIATQTKRKDSGFIEAKVNLNSHKTVYAKFGEVILLGSVLIVACRFAQASQSLRKFRRLKRHRSLDK